jgi:hypothetical protein
MQYFSKLPKTSFESTIGSFNISDFFTYVDPTQSTLTPYFLEYDNSNTLVEAAALTYQDPDSFWIFCLSTENYNPFTLNKQNSKIQKELDTPKLNVEMTVVDKGSTLYVPPKGSIVVLYEPNTGSSASFSSIGNFNINGAFTVVDDDFYFSRSSIVKDQKNGLILKEGLTGSQYVVITQSATGGYQLNAVYNKTIEPALSKVAYTYDTASGKFTGEYKSYSSKVSNSVVNSSTSKTPTKYGGTTTVDSVTYETVLKTQINKLPAYSSNLIGSLVDYLVTTKYY